MNVYKLIGGIDGCEMRIEGKKMGGINANIRRSTFPEMRASRRKNIPSVEKSLKSGTRVRLNCSTTVRAPRLLSALFPRQEYNPNVNCIPSRFPRITDLTIYSPDLGLIYL